MSLFMLLQFPLAMVCVHVVVLLNILNVNGIVQSSDLQYHRSNGVRPALVRFSASG